MQLIERFDAKDGDLLLLVADKEAAANKALAPLRCRVGRDLKLYDPGTFEFVWVVDFPLFDWNTEEKRYDSVHHPFTAPVPEDLGKLDTDPLHIRSQAYDIVLNGNEIGGGSIRIHRPEVQQKIFDLLNITREQAEPRFGFFLKALRLRRAAARRHRPGPGPAHHAPDRHGQHPRRDRVPQDAARPVPADRRAERGGPEAARRAEPPRAEARRTRSRNPAEQA